MELEEKKEKHIIARIILMCIGLIGIFFYIFPVMLHSNVNLGTIAGVLFFGMIFIYGLCKCKIDELIKKGWKNKVCKAIYMVILVFVAGVIMTVGFLTYLMISSASSKPRTEVTVVVLGCAVHGNGPSLMLKERLDAAYDYLVEHEDAPCILTGGQGSDESMSEAQCMWNYLTERGISADRLYMEDQSTSTRENMAFSLEIINENQLPMDVAIVTNEFHEYRAGRIADKLGLTYYAIPGRTAWWLLPTYYFREMMGIIYEWIM